MTEFVDGPAHGQTLMLRRSPTFLRVVVDPQGIDALDQLDDKPAVDEKVVVYRLVESKGTVCLRPGGCFKIAIYRLYEKQPDRADVCLKSRWEAWAKEMMK